MIIITSIIIILIVSFILFAYIYIRPFMKGTYVSDNNPNCHDSNKGCLDGTWCCRDPAESEGSGWCMSKKCSDIRLENPVDSQIRFFKFYTLCVLVLLFFLIMLIINK